MATLDMFYLAYDVMILLFRCDVWEIFMHVEFLEEVVSKSLYDLYYLCDLSL